MLLLDLKPEPQKIFTVQQYWFLPSSFFRGKFATDFGFFSLHFLRVPNACRLLTTIYYLQKRKPKTAETGDSSEPVQKRLRPSAAFQGGRPTKFSCSLCDFDTPVRIRIRLLLGYSEIVNYVPFLIRFSYKKWDRLPNCEFCPV
jgi:hypothetical protein